MKTCYGAAFSRRDTTGRYAPCGLPGPPYPGRCGLVWSAAPVGASGAPDTPRISSGPRSSVPGIFCRIRLPAVRTSGFCWETRHPVTAARERIENAALSISTRIDITAGELARIDPAPPVRFSDRHISLSVWIFDDEALVCTHLADQLGHASPTFHVRYREPGGLFDGYAGHVEHLWSVARP
jgi:hypothetical protein